MTEPTVDQLTLGLILYVMLPLWALAGVLDYFCHKRTKIEENSGLTESILHATMGIQVGIPIWLGIFFEINVLLLLLCVIVFVCHEVVAHFDVRWASTRRRISIWEQHAHSYLATVPFYLLALLVCRNWGAFVRLVTLNWSGDMVLIPRAEPVGTMKFVLWYAGLVFAAGILPYAEEILRCWLYQRRQKSA